MDGFPEKYHIVDLHPIDRVIGVALYAGRILSGLTAHLQHEGISEHFQREAQLETTRMAQIQLNFDESGREVDGNPSR